MRSGSLRMVNNQLLGGQSGEVCVPINKSSIPENELSCASLSHTPLPPKPRDTTQRANQGLLRHPGFPSLYLVSMDVT